MTVDDIKAQNNEHVVELVRGSNLVGTKGICSIMHAMMIGITEGTCACSLVDVCVCLPRDCQAMAYFERPK